MAAKGLIIDTSARNPAKFARLMARDPAPIRYVIYFTPRSGSSWLTDIVHRAGGLGRPAEFCNPKMAPQHARNMHAATLRDYVEGLVRRNGRNGVFGMEATLYQINRLFGDGAGFIDAFGPHTPFWLIREDIVLQAVSLYRMVESGVGHSTHSSAAEVSARQDALPYDGARIAHWLEHIRRLEAITETHFERFGLSPIRLSYEGMMQAGPVAVVAQIAQGVGAQAPAPPDTPPRHQKVGTDRNVAFAERFRETHRDQLARLDDDRADMLARLHGRAVKGPAQPQQTPIWSRIFRRAAASTSPAPPR